MTLRETHKLRKLDETFAGNDWTRLAVTLDFAAGDKQIQITVRRLG